MNLRQEITKKLAELTQDAGKSEDISNWAISVMQGGDTSLLDPKVWEALDRMSGADLMSGPNTYLHSREDFSEWLRDFTEQ
ncbi:DNA-binding protein [Streptomyces botrytidirepellens]|uniref:DNA-binding protein n=1 Tax=Streptomyces botrytidirepellens TaxID=2486417 RepID=A0A3M8W622_9ACTN|nr:DNA-binding protein [Streptomyces botrytidirepellens]RNG24141.1 DNA-binding protein [Streptomyces botrytidirepellens]